MTPKYQPKHGLQEIMAELLNLTERAATFEEAGAGQWAARILRECKAAGFVTPEGEVRKVLGRLWTTEDGCILGVDYEGFLFREESCGDIQRCWPSVCINNIDQDYKWYSTPEAARKAGEGGQ